MARESKQNGNTIIIVGLLGVIFGRYTAPTVETSTQPPPPAPVSAAPQTLVAVPGASDTAYEAPEEADRPARPVALADDSEDEDVYYPNCSAARAAGAAPIHVGEPGYTSKLDRDGDGVACE